MILWKNQNKLSEEAEVKEKDLGFEVATDDGRKKNAAKGSTSGETERTKKSHAWWKRGIVVALIASLLFTAYYGIFRDRAKNYVTDPTASEANIAWLYESSYVLYRDLYNRVNGTQADYKDIYLDVKEGYDWILDEGVLQRYIDAMSQPQVSETDSSESNPTADIVDSTTVELVHENLDEATYLMEDWQRFHEYFNNLESNFEQLNHLYGYHITDNATGHVISNLSMTDLNAGYNNYFQLSFMFDEAGNVSVGEDIVASDAELIRRYANGEIRENGSVNPVSDELGSLKNYVSVLKPVNCTVTFCISADAWENMNLGFHVNEYGRGDFSISRYVESGMRYAYVQAGAGSVLTILFLLVGALGLVLTRKRETENFKYGKTFFTSVEFLVIGGFLWYGAGAANITRWVATMAEGDASKILRYTLDIMSHSTSELLVHIFNALILTIFFLGAWYIGFCVSEVKVTGFKGYLRKHSILYRIFPYTKKKVVNAYEKIANLDLTKDANKTIIWLLVINGVILLAISSLWLAGWALVLVYSLIMYVILRKYVSDLQKRYGILLNATNEIAKGNLNVSIDENLGVFEPFKPEIAKIQEGFKHAVEQEVKSQRMKSELITNVSHDLKTPLTAIITYINLLKEKNLTEEQRMEYLDTLERKSLRLKVLIEDLFEVSKANSNNVTLNIMDVDIMNLVKQVSFEMSDKLEAAGLDVRLNLPEGRITLPLDSQKTYRVYENLFANVAKYAMPGTRVYVSGALRDGCVEIILKNITAQEITVDSSELTERFVRNDSSRNTEGSGLGLAIAKSFMELQGGSLKVEVDGDLFKASTVWPITGNQS